MAIEQILISVDDATDFGTGEGTYTKISDTAYNCEMTVTQAVNITPALRHATTAYLAGTSGRMTFQCDVLTGQPIVHQYNAGSPVEIAQPITLGLNTIDINYTNAQSNVYIYLDGRKLFSVEISDVKIEVGEATTTVEIEWIDSLSVAATGNKIYRDTVPSTGEVEIADIANGIQIYQDATAETGTEYKYEVQAYDGVGGETTLETVGVNTQFITTA